MSDAMVLGNRPIPVTVVLSSFSPFVSNIVRSENWADGTEIALEFRATEDDVPIVWEAGIAGDTASWNVSAADAAIVLDAGKLHARLRYTAPGGPELTWAVGLVATA